MNAIFEADIGSRSRRLFEFLRQRLVKIMVIGTSAVLLIVSFPGHVLAASGEELVVGYITWGNLDNVWGGGPGLVTEPSLAYLTDIVGPAIVPSSTSNPVVAGMYGELTQFAYVVRAGHARGAKVSPYLFMSIGDLGTIVSNGKLSVLANSVRDLLVQQNLDGISLDIEGGVNQSYLASLVDALYAVLNPAGKFISISAQYGEFGGIGPDVSLATAQKLAYIMPMCYDMWGYADQASGYPHSSLVDSQAAMTKWVTAGYPKTKLVMGIPFYARTAYDATLTPAQDYKEYKDIVAAINPAASTDSAVISGRSYWWGGLDTDRAKVRWLADNGYAGAMIFAVGYDKLNDSRSLLQAIHDELNAGASPTPPPSVALSVSTSALPDGTVGQPYSQTLTATGGATPYVWTVASGVLPLGLSVSTSGAISGTPTTSSGPISVTFRVTDSTKAAVTKALSITIIDAAWDVNLDGAVNVLDLMAISQHFGEKGAAGWIRQDVNRDGVISVLDTILVSQHTN